MDGRDTKPGSVQEKGDFQTSPTLEMGRGRERAKDLRHQVREPVVVERGKVDRHVLCVGKEDIFRGIAR